jgi:hypothetical protein
VVGRQRHMSSCTCAPAASGSAERFVSLSIDRRAELGGPAFSKTMRQHLSRRRSSSAAPVHH